MTKLFIFSIFIVATLFIFRCDKPLDKITIIESKIDEGVVFSEYIKSDFQDSFLDSIFYWEKILSSSSYNNLTAEILTKDSVVYRSMNIIIRQNRIAYKTDDKILFEAVYSEFVDEEYNELINFSGLGKDSLIEEYGSYILLHQEKIAITRHTYQKLALNIEPVKAILVNSNYLLLVFIDVSGESSDLAVSLLINVLDKKAIDLPGHQSLSQYNIVPMIVWNESNHKSLEWIDYSRDTLNYYILNKGSLFEKEEKTIVLENCSIGTKVVKCIKQESGVPPQE
ncbi:MAG: hypothetical protein ACRBFS_17435 [Aureispira sp.]